MMTAIVGYIPLDFKISRLAPTFKERNMIVNERSDDLDKGEFPENPTWEDSIKGFFTSGDIACMKGRGLDLSDYQTVKDNAQDIARSVESGRMPPGNPWPSSKIEAFQRWVTNGTPKGETSPTPPVNQEPGWSPTNAPEAGSRYDDIWFISPEVGWAVNSDGLVLHTEDAGETWTQQFRTPAVGTRAVYLRCISFGNDQKGWVGTLTEDYRMFKTENAGINWQLVSNLPSNSPLAICGLYAVNESVVYASGSNYPYKRYPARVIKTTDGGITWTAMEMGEYASNLIDIFFFDEMHGFVVGGYSDKEDPEPEKNVPDYSDVVPVVLYTEDGGITWDNRVANLTFEPGEWGWKINFVNQNVGYVSLESFNRAAILKTTDGGKTWIRLPIDDPQGNANLEGVGFITEDRGWVGGWGSADFTAGYTSGTIDGGITWVDANQVGRFINRFRFIGNPVTVGYACGRTVYKYNPEGDTVTTLPQPTSATSASRERMIKTFSLERFENTVEFDIVLPEETEHAWLHIWNRFGAEVRLLLNEANPTPGGRKLIWDGLDDSGKVVPPGIYIFRLTVDNNADSGNFYLERKV